jgi:hypothetical protein
MFKAVAVGLLVMSLIHGSWGVAQAQTPQNPATKSNTEAQLGPTTPTPLAKRGVVMPLSTPNRSIFMNGIDISSSRNQDLRNVHVKISENGDIYIAAPQYQVTEEETFLPLSTYTKAKPPEHKPAQPLTSSPQKSDSVKSDPKSDPKSEARSEARSEANSDAPVKPASSSVPGDSGIAVKAAGNIADSESDRSPKTETMK